MTCARLMLSRLVLVAALAALLAGPLAACGRKNPPRAPAPATETTPATPEAEKPAS